MPYRDFEIRQLSSEGDAKTVKHDSFQPKVFLNSDKHQIKNVASFPVTFNEYEDYKVLLVKRED